MDKSWQLWEEVSQQIRFSQSLAKNNGSNWLTTRITGLITTANCQGQGWPLHWKKSASRLCLKMIRFVMRDLRCWHQSLWRPHFVYLQPGQMAGHCQLSASHHSRVITARTNKHWGQHHHRDERWTRPEQDIHCLCSVFYTAESQRQK